MKTQELRRAPFMLLAGLALLAGLTAALRLLGLTPPLGAARLDAVHGPVMVLGFVGTLISLERAAALGRWWGFAAPVLLGLGSLAAVAPAVPLAAGQVALLVGALLFVAVYLPLWRRRPDDATLVEALGACASVGAAALWLGGVDVPRLAPWLVAFLVLTIAGERLELARIQIGEAAQTAVLVAAAGLVTAAAAALLWPRATFTVGLTLGALTLLLGATDIAHRTARGTGQTAFSGRMMLAGYAWLAVAAAVWLVSPGTPRGFAYDAAIHAVTLGFVMSMVLAHAATILPAVLRIRLPYHPAMYAPAALLHGGLAVRLVADAAADRPGWQAGGVVGVVALLLFVAVAAGLAVSAGSRRPA